MPGRATHRVGQQAIDLGAQFGRQRLGARARETRTVDRRTQAQHPVAGGEVRKMASHRVAELVLDQRAGHRAPGMPFGGYKQSGNGRDKSLHALEKYTELKTTWIRLN